MSTKQKFVHLKGEIPDDQAKELFTFLKEAIPWGLGVPSRRHTGITRLAYPLEYRDLKSLCSAPVISKIENVISEHSIRKEIAGVYLNYYRNGNDWTPNHTHPGSSQLVLSLGTIRKFAYGKRNLMYLMEIFFYLDQDFMEFQKMIQWKMEESQLLYFLFD